MSLVTTITVKQTLDNLEVGSTKLVGQLYSMKSSRDADFFQFVVRSSLLILFLSAGFKRAHYAIHVPDLEKKKETNGDLLPLSIRHGNSTYFLLFSTFH